MRKPRNIARYSLGLALAALTKVTILALAHVALAQAQVVTPSWTAATALPTLHANGKIAFTSDRDGNHEIYVMNADGSNQVRITNHPGVDDCPTWSPDGTRIAFVSQPPSGGYAIYTMNADGTNKIEVTPLNSGGSSLSWSPDGSRIAFQENSDIFVVNIDGSNRHNLTNGPEWDDGPSWSPDGSKILFSRYLFGNPYNGDVLHTIKPDGTDLQALPNGFADGFDDFAPQWSPAGDKITFLVNVWDFYSVIFTANADGTNRQFFEGCPSLFQNCESELDRFSPVWSPDGRKIVFTISDRFATRVHIYVKNIDGSGLVQLTNTAGRNFNPSWQPLTPSGPNTVQFSSSSYTVSEGSPRVDITLSRSGDTTSSASVSFATNDAAGLQDCNVINGVASPRCDYINTLGTMSFAAGETSKSLSIAIVDDSYAEGSETFTISLNNASGTTLGTQSTATVTIIDNDGSSNGPNPIDNTNFFVRQQYIDFLGREPDPPGFNGWVDSINNCSGDTTQCDRIHVSQQFFQSEEFQSRGYFVYRFYPVAFGRKPDYAEFVPDLARVSGFLDNNQLEAAKVQFIADFMARPAFASQYNSLSNAAYVDALINTAGVNLSNRQTLIDSLNNSAATRAQVLRQIVESSEVATKYNHQAFAVMEYFGYLRRQPDSFYLDWITVLDRTNDPRGMVNGFVNSPEYRQRFGP
jgi:Tol biopolymer transport system component